jgi:hypothetical protein
MSAAMASMLGLASSPADKQAILATMAKVKADAAIVAANKADAAARADADAAARATAQAQSDKAKAKAARLQLTIKMVASAAAAAAKAAKEAAGRKEAKAARRQKREAEEVSDTPVQACVLTEWGPWDACSRPCGAGLRHREREVTTPGVYKDGRAAKCPSLRDYQTCNTSPCAPTALPTPPPTRDCLVTTWGEWTSQPLVSVDLVTGTPCSRACGGGWQFRNRSHSAGSVAHCPPLKQLRPCNQQPCGKGNITVKTEDCLVRGR